jgi:hypothetical protein
MTQTCRNHDAYTAPLLAVVVAWRLAVFEGISGGAPLAGHRVNPAGLAQPEFAC